jgi:hypothetical protein
VPTTQISLVRLHTEAMQPPRALWVPFELGRPLGVPDDAAWQTRVLLAALRLLETPSGPVLEDFPDDAPTASDDGSATLVCPLNVSAPQATLSDADKLRREFQQEIVNLRPWYERSVSLRGRTTVGASRLDPDALGAFIAAMLDDELPPSPREDLDTPDLLKLATEDVKAYYFEALAAQPGQHDVDSATQADWFWRDTTAGHLFFAMQQRCLASDDPVMQHIGASLLIPRARTADSPLQQQRS